MSISWDAFVFSASITDLSIDGSLMFGELAGWVTDGYISWISGMLDFICSNMVFSGTLTENIVR